MNVINKQYTTHLPMLIKCVQATEGPILELGAGLCSTPVLHWLCADTRRQLFTFEETQYFYNYAKKFQSRNHHIRLTDWTDFKVKGYWSVALIDQASKHRTKTALYLKDRVDYIILHDSEGELHYHYNKLWPHFKYRFDYKKHTPWTTVVSNTKDLTWLN